MCKFISAGTSTSVPRPDLESMVIHAPSTNVAQQTKVPNTNSTPQGQRGPHTPTGPSESIVEDRVENRINFIRASAEVKS